MSWPLPPRLQFATGAGAPTTLGVQVHLLDGQLIHGVMSSSETLSETTHLKLIFMGQNIVLAVAAIRSVTCIDWLMLKRNVDPAATYEQHPDGASPVNFHVLFSDGKTLEGRTFGFENRRIGGVYLYIQQNNCRFKAIWIPRNALQSIRIDVPGLPDKPVPAQQTATTALQVGWPPAASMNELSILLDRARDMPMLSLAEAMFQLDMIDEHTFHEFQAQSQDKLFDYIESRLANSDGFELQLQHARARMVNSPEVDLEKFSIDPAALAKIPWDVATRHSVVPLGIIFGTLYVASTGPMSQNLHDLLRVIADCNLANVWAAKVQIDNRLTRANHDSPSPRQNAPDAGLPPGEPPDAADMDLESLLISAQNEIKVRGAEVHNDAVDERSSVVLLVKRMIMDAYQHKASDIHIETNADEELSRVRFRIDGDLEEYLKLPPDLRAALVSRIKVMSKLDISERRRPQDGKINFAHFSGIKLELRVAILPTNNNLEDVVLRLLATSKPIPLVQLGFSARDEAIVKRLSLRPYGLLLACGPTGSGKTTTLHSLLSEINTDNRKIWTAEDPIEITQAGLRQLQVNPKIGLTFATAMRAFLRANPDVIMIGEVRDEETAGVCIEASLTGHLVFSTLHTNGAAESVSRLLELGMDPMNFGDSLIGIVAQRLVRSLCQHCAVAQVLSNAEFEALSHEYIDGSALTLEEGGRRLLAAAPPSLENSGVTPVSVRLAVGCDRCSGRGYKGRIGIYEVLENVGDIKHKIQTRSPTSEIFAEASGAGMRTLRQDALEKTMAGLIDLKQARTVYA